VTCAVVLWWLGLSARPREPRWLLGLYVFDAVVISFAVIRAVGVTRRFSRARRTKKRLGGSS